MSEDTLERLSKLGLFAHVAEEELAAIADMAEEIYFPTGSTVFQQGDVSDKFYIIESGQVSIMVRDETGAEAELTQFGHGDFFGEAGLLKDEPRNATVIALKDTTVYSIRQEDFLELVHTYPEIRQQLAQKARVRTGGGLERFDWQMEDEVTLLATRRHILSLMRAIPLVALGTLGCTGLVLLAFASFLSGMIALQVGLVVIAVLIWGLLVAWTIVDWTNDTLVITNRRVVHVERIMFISETRTEVPIEAVEDISLERVGVLAAWFDYATIHVRTAGGGGQINFTFLPEPEAAQQQILQQRELVTSELQEERQTAIRYEIAKAISPPGAPLPPAPLPPRTLAPVPTHKPPPTFWERLGQIAQLRIEQEGQIIWRKHWLVLIDQLLRPSATIAAGVIISVLFPKALPDLIILEPLFWLVIVIGLLWFVWEWADWANDLYILTPTNIIDIDRLPLKLRESRREGGLDRIQDIEVILPTFLSTVFNIGNVRIKTAAAGGDFSFDKVFDPRGVQRDIFHQLALYRRQKELQRRQREFADMAEWFAIYSQVTGQIQPAVEGKSVEGE